MICWVRGSPGHPSPPASYPPPPPVGKAKSVRAGREAASCEGHRCLSWLQGLAGAQRRPRWANSPGPQNVGAPFNHGGSGLLHESDIRPGLSDGGWSMSRGPCPQPMCRNTGLTRAETVHTCLPPPHSAPPQRKLPTLSPDSGPPGRAQSTRGGPDTAPLMLSLGTFLQKVTLDQRGTKEAQTGCEGGFHFNVHNCDH